jgi:O-antigen/teichoic acid export membrane protein
MGVLGVFVTTLSLLTVVSSLRYDLAIPYPRDDKEAGTLFLLAILAISVTTVVWAILILSGLGSRAPGLRETLTGSLIWWLPIGAWAAATYAALSFWMVRRRDFVTIGATKITQGFLQAGAQLLFGLLRVGASGLIVGQIIGSSAGLLRLARKANKEDRAIFASVTIKRLRITAAKFKRFPLYSTPAVLLDAATGAVPLLFIAARYGSGTAGLYTLVQRVIAVPFALLTVNLGQLVFGDLAELRRSGAPLMPMFLRRTAQIAGLGLTILLPLLIIIPLVLPRLFGERWAMAGTFFLILAPMIYAGFVSSPFGFVIDVLRRQELHLARETVRALIMATALVVAARENATIGRALLIISVAGTVNGIFYLLVSWRALVDHRDRRYPELGEIETSLIESQTIPN